MPKIQSFRDLVAWQKAMDLADMVYDLTENVPAREGFGLAYPSIRTVKRREPKP
jgi:hypothetical protein